MMAADPAEDWADLTNLAAAEHGSRVIFATDEWFAAASNMLKAGPALFDPLAFTPQGKMMDGWESRRRREPGHDWCIIRLGLPGFVRGIEIDTRYFTGNQAPKVSLLGACVDVGDDCERWLPTRSDVGTQGTAATPELISAAEAALSTAATWTELLATAPLGPGVEGASVHRFAVRGAAARRRVTHIRLNQYPDGGIARLRIWGGVRRDFQRELRPAGLVDLAAAAQGGRALACSNKHYGDPRNLLLPGRGANMGDGWETARNPQRPAVLARDASGFVDMPGVSEWVLLQLAAVAGRVEEVLVDTAFFKGNYPESIRLEACYAPGASAAEILGLDDGCWTELLPRVRLDPDKEHTFTLSRRELLDVDLVSHVRMSIFPDGGIMRIRILGHARAPMPEDAAGVCSAESDLLDWTAKQSRMLTCDGRLESLYTAERGYAFEDSELPHHHLMARTTHDAFATWKAEGRSAAIICGAWERLYIQGGFEYSTSEKEAVYNLQTNSIFIDIRIPTGWPAAERRQHRSLGDMEDDNLRRLARQHAFAGYSVCNGAVCTRHHAIDWNFVGRPRTRPNKWRVEARSGGGGGPSRWKELSFARDDEGQCCYTELWSRLPGDDGGIGTMLALRAVRGSDRDGFLVIVGDHFAYVRDRILRTGEPRERLARSCAELVDEALAAGQRLAAEEYLSLEAAYGHVSSGWIVHASLQPWREGSPLFDPGSLGVEGDQVHWDGERWDVLEGSVSALAVLLRAAPRGRL